MSVKLGTRCEIFIDNGHGVIKWGTTHPNTEPGKLDRYLNDLNTRFHVGRPVSRMVITRRSIPQEE
jgi:hypothetical protein